MFVQCWMRKEAAEPIDWLSGGKVHNWKNYISSDLQEMWDTFTLEQKTALIANAEDIAGKENWD